MKISISSSLSFYSLASFPASPSLLIILSPTLPETHTHRQTNLHHPPTPPSFLCPSGANESFGWAMIDLYLFSRPIIFRECISALSAWGPCQGQISPSPRGWEEWGKNIRHPPPPLPDFSLYSKYTHYTWVLLRSPAGIVTAWFCSKTIYPQNTVTQILPMQAHTQLILLAHNTLTMD